jgi:hypothetical protein
MSRIALAIALWLACGLAFAQKATTLTVMPSAGKAVGIVRTTAVGRWWVMDSKMTPVPAQSFKLSADAGGGSLCFFEGTPGATYGVLFIPDSVSETLAGASVKLGGSAPTDPTDPQPDPNDPSDPNQTTKPTAAHYLFDKSQNPVPAKVAAALAEINKATVDGGSTKILADEFEVHTTDGTGEIPDQYKVALSEANKIGIPCLVVMAGDRVLRTVKAPTTKEEVLNAVK